MHGDRLPPWVPLSLAVSAVAALAFSVIVPTLSEVDAIDDAAAGLERHAARADAAVLGAERARAERERLIALREALPNAEKDAQPAPRDGFEFRRLDERTTLVIRNARYFELTRFLSALDSAPLGTLEEIEFAAQEDGSVRVEARLQSAMLHFVFIADVGNSAP
ncbi:MAG: hypothetical protein SGJ09_07690 [Phycisphaerae bacterium]|nr:hypothetical protein [Phycisphaerae bacterium]